MISLEINVIEAKDLKKTHHEINHCYATVTVAGNKYVTKVTTPDWNAIFKAEKIKAEGEIVLTIYNKNEDFLGQTSLEVASFENLETVDRWLPLNPGATKDVVSGQIHVKIIPQNVTPVKKADEAAHNSPALRKRSEVREVPPRTELSLGGVYGLGITSTYPFEYPNIMYILLILFFLFSVNSLL